jgi:hypothetical protein
MKSPIFLLPKSRFAALMPCLGKAEAMFNMALLAANA